MPDSHAQLIDILKSFDTAMLVTGEGERLSARPMSIAAVEDDGRLYFATGEETPKVQELEEHPRATITLQSSSRFVSISGYARVLDDRALVDRLWSEAWRTWFPGGKDDPSLRIIEVNGEEAQFWDNAGGKGIAYALEAAKAYMQGRRPATDASQNAKVAM